MNQSNRGLWIGVIVIVIIAALGLWWIASSQPAGMGTNATSTAATSTGTSGGPAVTNETGTSVQAIVASLSGASNFQSEFVSTGVSAIVGASSTKYTVFVPLDTAYSNVTKGTISKMTGAQLKRLVEYQVVSGKEIQVGTQTLGNVTALSGDPLNFSDTNNVPMVNSAIVVSEYKGSNGIVYVINDVLIPPQKSTI